MSFSTFVTQNESLEIENQLIDQTKNSSCLSTEQRKKLTALGLQIGIGMVRDFEWAVLSYNNTDIFNNHLGKFWGPTLTQIIGSSLTVIGGIKILANFTSRHASFENKFSFLKQAVADAVASLSAIPVWNFALLLGNMAGKQLGYDDRSSSYFSSLFCGVAETAWQNAFVLPVLLNQKIEPLEVILNTAGGAIWQIIFQANQENFDSFDSSNCYSAAAQISMGVALTTFLMTFNAWKLKYKITHFFSEHNEDEPLLAEEEAMPLLAAKSETEEELSETENLSELPYAPPNSKTSNVNASIFSIFKNNKPLSTSETFPALDIHNQRQRSYSI